MFYLACPGYNRTHLVYNEDAVLKYQRDLEEYCCIHKQKESSPPLKVYLINTKVSGSSNYNVHFTNTSPSSTNVCRCSSPLRRHQGWASVLLKRTLLSFRSFPFFIKESSVLNPLVSANFFSRILI